MTAAELSKRLGISRKTLFNYRNEYPDRAPKSFSSLEEWTAFVAGIKVYDSERTKPKVEPLTTGKNGKEPAAQEDPDYNAQAERKQRIIKLELSNQAAEEELKIRRRDSVPLKDALDTLSVIAATARAELLEIPGEVAEALAGKEAAEIQRSLEMVLRKALEKLSWPETFLRPARA